VTARENLARLKVHRHSHRRAYDQRRECHVDSNFGDEAKPAPERYFEAQAADDVGRGAIEVLAPPFSNVWL
jgi:hypothetical protein